MWSMVQPQLLKGQYRFCCPSHRTLNKFSASRGGSGFDPTSLHVFWEFGEYLPQYLVGGVLPVRDQRSVAIDSSVPVQMFQESGLNCKKLDPFRVGVSSARLTVL